MKPPKAKLTEGSVGRHLVKMTAPMLLGITMMMAQAIIDAWFLGKVGDSALAAFSFGFPILMIITSVAIGLSAGTSSVVARAIGADDHRRAKRLATDSLMLSFIVTATMAGVGILTIDPLFKALGAPVDMLPFSARPFGSQRPIAIRVRRWTSCASRPFGPCRSPSSETPKRIGRIAGS